MSLLDLNNDCLLEIFKYLDLEHHFMMKEISKRFTTIIEGVWRLRYKKVDLGNAYDEAYFRTAHKSRYLFFMSAIQDIVQELIVDICMFMSNVTPERILERWQAVERFDCLKNYKFPQMKTLKYTVHMDLSGLFDFAEVFPALKSVELYWHSGQPTPRLEESIVTLMYCKDLHELSCTGCYRSTLCEVVLHVFSNMSHRTKITWKAYANEMLHIIADSRLALRVHTFPAITEMSNNIILSLKKLYNLRTLIINAPCTLNRLAHIIGGLPCLEKFFFFIPSAKYAEEFDEQMAVMKKVVKRQKRCHPLNVFFCIGRFAITCPQTFYQLTEFLTVTFLLHKPSININEIILLPR